jgi:quercetin dioxygenase-like cupin family protein
MYNRPTNKENATKLPIDQDAWLLFRFDQLEVVRLHLAPGDSMENHVNDWRIIFFVLRGRGSLDVEGQIYKLEQEQSIAVEAGKKRFWSNRGTQTLELLVMKSRLEP